MITYNYAAIDQAVQVMKAKVNEIQSGLDEQHASVKKVMGDWHGETSAAYERKFQEIGTALRNGVETLERMRTALETGSQDMQDADKKGAGSI